MKTSERNPNLYILFASLLIHVFEMNIRAFEVRIIFYSKIQNLWIQSRNSHRYLKIIISNSYCRQVRTKEQRSTNDSADIANTFRASDKGYRFTFVGIIRYILSILFYERLVDRIIEIRVLWHNFNNAGSREYRKLIFSFSRIRLVLVRVRRVKNLHPPSFFSTASFPSPLLAVFRIESASK